MKQVRTVIKSQNVPTTQKRVVETVISRRPRNGRKGNAQKHVEIITNAPVSRGITNVNTSKAYIVGSNGSLDFIDVAYEGYLRDILSPGPGIFGMSSLQIQPGLKQSFPWLADMAILYEAYSFRKLDFEFQSARGTGNDGKWYAAIDYDALDDAPVDKATLMSYSGSVDTNIWNHMKLKGSVMGARIFEKKFTRSGSVSGDLKTYDVGKLFVGVQSNAPLGTLIGEVHVDCVVRFMIRQLNTAASNLPSNTRSLVWNDTNATGGNIFTPESVPTTDAGPSEVANVERDPNTPITTSSLVMQTPGEYLVNLEALVQDGTTASNIMNGITVSYPAGARIIAELIGSSDWYSGAPNSLTNQFLQLAVKYAYNSTFANPPQGIDFKVEGSSTTFAGKVIDTVVRLTPALKTLLPVGSITSARSASVVRTWVEGDRQYLQLRPGVVNRTVQQGSPLTPSDSSHLAETIRIEQPAMRGAATSQLDMANLMHRRIN